MSPIAPPRAVDPPPPAGLDRHDAHPTVTYDSAAPAVVGLVGDRRPIGPVTSGHAAAVDSAVPVATPVTEQTRWPALQRRADVPDVTAVQSTVRRMGAGTTPAASWPPGVLPVRTHRAPERGTPGNLPVQLAAEPIAVQTTPLVPTNPAEPTTELFVQRADDGGEPAAAVTAPAVTTTPAAPAGSTSPTDVDTLVRRLYDPIVRRLKAELQLDRERAGHSLDLRH